MGSFHLSVADNVAALMRWHQNKHLNTEWQACPHEPCGILEPQFRKAWTP